jgi:hypothetical protein
MIVIRGFMRSSTGQLWIGYEPLHAVSTDDPSPFEWSPRTGPENPQEVQPVR